MRRKIPSEAARALDRIDQDPGKGTLFWWLSEFHDPIIERTRGKRIPWRTMLVDVQALGLTNAPGNPVENDDVLRATFRRVRALKQREVSANEKSTPRHRSRPTNTPPPLALAQAERTEEAGAARAAPKLTVRDLAERGRRRSGAG